MRRRAAPAWLVMWLAGCAAAPAAGVLPASPTPPPIPTDMQVEFPTLTPPGSEVDIRPVEELDPVAGLSPTPSGPTLIRLTETGCCAQPFWSADGQMILFIDKPHPTSPTGIYGVGLNGGTPQLVSEQIGLPSPDGRYLAYLTEDGETIVEEVAAGAKYVIPNDGLRVFFSPGSTRLAWADTDQTGNFDQRKAVIYVSTINGGDPRELVSIYGGGIAGWLDEETLLLVGRDRKVSQDVALFTLSVTNGQRHDLIVNQRIRSVRIAPGGEWIVYTITLHPDDATQDGLWVINRDGSQRYKLEVFGSGQWRDGSHLIIIPFEPDAPSHRLWQFDAETGQVTALTDPEKLPFKVMAGDWMISPTGMQVVFREAKDQALWLITLPPMGP